MPPPWLRGAERVSILAQRWRGFHNRATTTDRLSNLAEQPDASSSSVARKKTTLTIQDEQTETTYTEAVSYAPTPAGPLTSDAPTASNPPVAAPVAVAVPVPVVAPVAMAAPVPVATTAPTTVEPRVASNRIVARREFDNRVSNDETVRRVVVLIFGIVQLFIAARIVLVLLDARHANGIVSGILNISQPFVAPFEGILRTNSVGTSGSVLDVAAVLAIVGWAIVELIVIWILSIFQRRPGLGQV